MTLPTHDEPNRRVRHEDRPCIPIFWAPEDASDNAKEKVNRGKVIAVGPGMVDKEGGHIPLTVKPGDRVLMTKYGGDEFQLGDDEFVLVREDDILAVIQS